MIILTNSLFQTLLLGICAISPAGNEDEIPPWELSPEEYQFIREYDGNRIDPRDAVVEDYMAIPGFDPLLAARIVTLVGSFGEQWYQRLGPAEKCKLARYSRWIQLPGPERELDADLSCSTRLGELGESKRLSIESSTRNWELSLRARSERGCIRTAALVSGSFFHRKIQLFGGDFCPDIPLGLISSSASFSYPFSGNFPIRKSRLISRATGFYGEALRGAAAILKGSALRATAFGGIRRQSDLSYNREVAAGGILQLILPRLTAGAAYLGTPGIFLRGIHLRCPAGRIDLGAEVAFTAGSRLAWAGGARYGGDDVTTGMLLYLVDGGFESELGKVPAAGGTVTGEKRGIEWVLRSRLCEAVSAGFSAEGVIRRVYHSDRRSISLRAALEGKSGGNSLRLEWRGSLFSRDKLVPCPAHPESRSGMDYAIKSILSIRTGDYLRFRFSCRYPYGEAKGLMVYPSMRIESGGGRLRTDLGTVIYRSFRGDAEFYAYIPSTAGSYPWKRFSANGRFDTARVRVKLGVISLIIAFSREKGGKGTADIQISAEF
ncbi:MAG: hypothetical protein GF417_11090 [Candidatus Latescibacteria bacterium]|nr:hypothetical protein [bacterium]MBD3424971.1 hypothetical protein [Candidatus Latescibacterota bacterium]